MCLTRCWGQFWKQELLGLSWFLCKNDYSDPTKMRWEKSLNAFCYRACETSLDNRSMLLVVAIPKWIQLWSRKYDDCQRLKCKVNSIRCVSTGLMVWPDRGLGTTMPRTADVGFDDPTSLSSNCDRGLYTMMLCAAEVGTSTASPTCLSSKWRVTSEMMLQVWHQSWCYKVASELMLRDKLLLCDNDVVIADSTDWESTLWEIHNAITYRLYVRSHTDLYVKCSLLEWRECHVRGWNGTNVMSYKGS